MLAERADRLLHVELAGCDGRLRVIAAGELDLATAPYLYERVERVLRGRMKDLVLDLSGVTFMDSSGLHGLLHLAADSNARLRVILSAPVARILEITNTGHVLEIIHD